VKEKKGEVGMVEERGQERKREGKMIKNGDLNLGLGKILGKGGTEAVRKEKSICHREREREG